MELSGYIRILRRWAWLIGLLALVFGSLSFITSRTQPAIFQASTMVRIGSSQRLSNPGQSLIFTEFQLAQTYAALAKTFPVLDATVKSLQLPFSADALKGLFSTAVLPNTALMTITVTYGDAVVVADIANELATQLIVNSPTNLTAEQLAQVRQLQGEIEYIVGQLDRARIEQQGIDERLVGDLPTDERDTLNRRRGELAGLINTGQANLAALYRSLIDIQNEGGANVLTVVERARIPTSPINGGGFSGVIIAAVLGGALAAALAFGIEYLNDTVRTPSEVTQLLGLPLLGTIAPFGKKGTYKLKLITWAQPRSTISEGYRALRVNLMYMDRDDPREHHTFVVTSPNPEEGKSVTAANLAVTFANTGMRVLLIDADMRRPSQHQIFDLPNTVGLSNVLSSDTISHVAAGEVASVNGAEPVEAETNVLDPAYIRLLISNIIYHTEVPGLDLITAGPSPANPNELLGTVQLQALVRTLSLDEKYDVVIFDTPPVLTVSDSSVLANVVAAHVVLVVEAGRTHRGAAARAAQQLISIGVKVSGIVLNRLNPRDVDAGYGYYYYYGYYGYGSTEQRQAAEGARPVPAPMRNNRSS